MKIITKMKKFLILSISVIFIMVINACSTEPKEDMATSTENIAEPETTEERGAETNTMVTESARTEESESDIMEGDPIVAMVKSYEDNIIVLIDIDDDIIYYFSTENAQVVEGASPIAVGDIVEITYRGVQGDEKHPGQAVKVVAESEMYK